MKILIAQAKTHVQCYVTCPYCKEYQNRLDELRNHFDLGEPRADKCEAEIKCDYCKKLFIVDLIEY